MAMKGTIRAACPGGCEPVDVEVWSFIRGDMEEGLRESLLAGDLNLMACGECARIYMPDATIVYFDPGEDLLMFIFPESYRAQEERWREKMREDYEAMRKIYAGKIAPPSEPLLFFGVGDASQRMQRDQDLEDEARIAEFMAPELGLSVYPVDRVYARSRELPRLLLCSRKAQQEESTRNDALAGVNALLQANDRLGGYRRWLSCLGEGDDMPPRAREKKD